MASNCTYGKPRCWVCGEGVTGNGFGRRAHLKGHWLAVMGARPVPKGISNHELEAILKKAWVERREP